MGDMEIVSKLRTALAQRIGDERFSLWFAGSDCLRVEGEQLVILAPDQFSLDRLRTHFRSDVEEAGRAVLKRQPVVIFRIDGQLAVAAPIQAPEERAKPKRQRATPSSGRNGSPPLAELDSFVVGDANRVAYTAASMISKQLGAVTPLVIYGPAGCGKTHLLQSILSSVQQGRRLRRGVLLAAEKFTSDFLEALHGSGLPSFRRKHRGVELLLIDDVQFFCGKRATLVELLHTIDTLLREGRQVVLAADRPPAQLRGMGTELTTRLAAGLVCGIQPPDVQTRLEIARQLVHRRKIEAPEDVLEFVAAAFPGDARQISGALNRLHATGQALQAPITLTLAESALSDLISHARRPVQLPDIEKAVCEIFGLEPKALRSARKGQSVTQPRMLAMWLARKHTRAAFSEIGDYFGRRSHSTVISAHKRVNGWMESKSTIALDHGPCSVEDLVRRAETLLRTG